MKKFLRMLIVGIVCVFMSAMLALAACSNPDDGSDDESGGSSSSSESSSSNSSSSESSSSNSSSSESSSSGSNSSSSSSSSSSGSSSSSVVSSIVSATMAETSGTLNTGDTKELSVNVTMTSGSFTGTVTWETDNENVATVTGSGTSATVTATGAGTATIKATVGNITVTYTVTVKQATIDGFISTAAYSESMYATWSATNVSNTTAYYKLSSSADTDNNWTEVDGNLIRMTDTDEARVDMVGLKAGTYDLKVTVNGTTKTATNLVVKAYDRSGYAHFNTDGYDEGVGAYTDDGTLKDGALVIYLTDDNKNDVTNYCYTYSADTGEYTQVTASDLISNYLTCSSDTTYGSGHTAVGIGEILNNRRYSGNDRHNVGIAALCDAYGAVAIRVIGTVEADLSSDGLTATITGLTDYDATTNGGSTGDNGRMARMTNAHDLTIEGIGADATIQGWGLHFIASDVLGNYQSSGSGAGKSFEVRNITFTEYPEDAVGMEGVQGLNYDATGSVTSGASSEEADLLSPVEYCWIHNNSFLPGYCANPAESDKAEGDGSCDFKRGQYYTLSYNYFEYCHKTNLIGSSDTSLQFNISMHHNYWYNCGSRIPLARRANIHFYNNYVYGNAGDSSADLSYVHSVRANSYLFAENNYYEGCKNVIRGGAWEGGAEKSYGNMYYECFYTATPTQVASRTTAVSNSCAFTYKKIDYSSFDTDSSLFYYDEDAQASDCYITSAVTARAEAIKGAGVNDDDPVTNTNINAVTPSYALVIDETNGLTVDLTSVSKGSSTVSNVQFTNITGTGSTIKGKGQMVTFTLASEAQLTASCTAKSTLLSGELVGADGTVYASKFTDLTIVLPAGTYVIASGEIDKELTINSLKFEDTAASSAARVSAATAAINALSAYTSKTATELAADTTLLDEFSSAVSTAQTAYSALTSSELADFSNTLVEALDNAISLLNNAKADVVEAYITQIGTVTADSYSAINTARTAYDALTADQKALVTNYSTLTAAETAYEQYAVQNVIDMISALSTYNNVTVSDRDTLEKAIAAYEEAQAAYDALDNGESGDDNPQNSVTNASTLSNLANLEEMYVFYDFVDLLDNIDADDITLSDSADVTTLQTYYSALTNTSGSYYSQFSTLLSDTYSSYVTKYNAILEAYSALASQSMTITFASNTSDTYYTNYGNVTVAGSTVSNKTAIVYDGTTYSVGWKLNSSGTVTITTSSKMNITLYFSTDNSGNKVNVGDTVCTLDSTCIVSTTVEAGTFTISKNSGESCLYVIVLTPAS